MAYTPENNPYIPGDPYSYDLKWMVEKIKATDQKLADLIESYGMPIVVSSAAEMTDSNKLYIYVGSELGYTSGDWYYYNENTQLWTSGGAYGGYPVDGTLSTTSTNAVENKVIATAVNNLNNRINNLADMSYLYNAFHGKTVIVIGDSLTIGSGASLGHTWIELLGSEYGADVHNYGISGSKISTGGDNQYANDMATRIDNILASHASCDFFVLMGGANDKNQNVPLGNSASTGSNTFIGAIKQILVKALRKYKSNCRYYTMTTYHRYDDYNEIGLTELDYVKAMQQASALYSIPCFDNYNDCGIVLNTTEFDSNPPFAWADIGTYLGGSTKNHHFSPLAYQYLFPKYAAFLANGFIDNPIQQLIYTTDAEGAFWTREVLDNGLIQIRYRRSFESIPLSDTYAPLRISQVFTVNAPSNIFALTQIYQVQISANGDGIPTAFFNGNGTNGTMKFWLGRFAASSTTFTGRVNITLIGAGPST